jgi:hypothetical protein
MTPRVVFFAPHAFYAEGAFDTRGILALAHRGVTHVRGKDCVHPDIGRVVVKDDLLFLPGRADNGRAGPCAEHGRERSSS